MYFGWNEHPLACLVRSFSFKPKMASWWNPHQNSPKIWEGPQIGLSWAQTSGSFSKVAFSQRGGHFLGFTLMMFNLGGSKHVALLILKRKAMGNPNNWSWIISFFFLIKVNVKPGKKNKTSEKNTKKTRRALFPVDVFFFFRNAALAHTHRLRLDPEDANVGTDSWVGERFFFVRPVFFGGLVEVNGCFQK